jgi:hypothetical protein
MTRASSAIATTASGKPIRPRERRMRISMKLEAAAAVAPIDAAKRIPGTTGRSSIDATIAPHAPPSAMRHAREGGLVRGGRQGSLSSRSSPAAMSLRTPATAGRARKANGLPWICSLPVAAARLTAASGVIERPPVAAPSAAARSQVVEPDILALPHDTGTEPPTCSAPSGCSETVR